MARIMFVDDRWEEIQFQWDLSGCGKSHELVPFEKFEKIERTLDLVQTLRPDAILIGYGLSRRPTTGADVVLALRAAGYAGRIFSNSGGGPEPFALDGAVCDADVSRDPGKLQEVVGKFFNTGDF